MLRGVGVEHGLSGMYCMKDGLVMIINKKSSINIRFRKRGNERHLLTLVVRWAGIMRFRERGKNCHSLTIVVRWAWEAKVTALENWIKEKC